jgi:hypothetical protein
MDNFLTVNDCKALAIGTRVAFPNGADAYPDFLFRDRLTGTVTESEDDGVWVKIDQYKPELDEWDNQIQVWFWDQGDDELPSQRVERLLSSDYMDGSLDRFIQAYCPPRGIEIDGDVFGVMFTGLQTEWTESEAIAVIEDAARIYDLRNPNRA